VGSADHRILHWPSADGPTALVPLPPATPTVEERPGIVHVVPLCRSAFTTEERAIVAIGADLDPRRISWSDLERPGAFTPDVANLAGSKQLNSNGIALCARQVPQGHLIFATDDVHLMAFAGPPFGYGIARVGAACGPLAPNAIATALGQAAWMGRQNFWKWNGAVEPLACPFQGFIYDNLNRHAAARSFAFTNGVFPEIWFCYPDQNSLDPNRYAAWNFQTGVWIAGALDRTAGTDPQSYGLPLAGDASGRVYAHEIGWLADGVDRGAKVFAETGDIELGAGDQGMLVRAIVPDFEGQDQTQLHLFGTWEPEDAGFEDFGIFPYTRTDGIIDALVETRALRLRIEGVSQAIPAQVAGWTLGQIRLDVAPGSGR